MRAVGPRHTARILTLPDAAACSRVAFSAAGDALACAGFSDKVVIWTDAGDAPRVVAGLPTMADIRSVAFDERGQRLLSWLPGDPAFRIWSLGSGAVTTLDASAEWAVQIGPETMATLGPATRGGRERVLRRWSLDKGTAEEVARWTPPPGLRLDQPGLRPVSVAPTLRWIAFGDDRDVVLRGLDSRPAPERRLERHAARIREVRFDRRAERLLSLDETGLFCLWSVPSGELLREWRTVPPHRYSVPEFSPDGSQVSWTAGDGTTYLWNLLTSMEDPPLLLRRTDLRDPGDESFDPQGRWLATSGWGSVALWPIQSPHVSTLSGHVEGPVQDLAFSPDSRLLASCARDGARLWSVDAAGGRMRRVELDGDYYCYGIGFTSDSRTLAVNAPYMGTYLVPLDGGTARRVLDFRGERAAPMPLAFDAAGRTLAVAPMYAPADASMRLRVADLASGREREFPLRTDGSADGYSSGAHYLKYLADGRLLIAGANGIRRWDPESGAIERVLWDSRFAAVDTDQAGRTVVALLGNLAASRLRLLSPELVVLDGGGQRLRTITTHGNLLMPTLAVDRDGRVVVTGDANGIVRVGSVDGREPHLLVAHAGPVNRVAISPDGRWIASASGREIRMWPMPDLTKPPLHRQPREELIAKLLSLTNLRVVQDPASATGWTVQVGPFPGWKQAPTW
jgi:WD40 repeat protein